MARQVKDWEHYNKKSWGTISCLICKSTFTFSHLSERILKRNGFYKIIVYNGKHINELEGWICKKCYKKLKANAKG
jgi:hypothetical protein